MSKNVNQVHFYIRKVAKYAFEQEYCKGPFAYQFCVLDDVCLLDYISRCSLVDSRIKQELQKSFKENTGFNLVDRHVDIGQPSKFYFGGGIVDLSHTIAFCKILGSWTGINCYVKTEDTKEYLNPDFENNPSVANAIIVKIKDLVWVDNLYFELESGWNQYCTIYEKLYGFKPKAQEKLFVSPVMKLTY